MPWWEEEVACSMRIGNYLDHHPFPAARSHTASEAEARKGPPPRRPRRVFRVLVLTTNRGGTTIHSYSGTGRERGCVLFSSSRSDDDGAIMVMAPSAMKRKPLRPLVSSSPLPSGRKTSPPPPTTTTTWMLNALSSFFVLRRRRPACANFHGMQLTGRDG